MLGSTFALPVRVGPRHDGLTACASPVCRLYARQQRGQAIYVHHVGGRSKASRIASVATPNRAVELLENSSEAILLVGDIGGTNARFCLYRANMVSGGREEVFGKTYPTKNYTTFYGALRVFLAEKEVAGQRVDAACLAVAGPVSNNVCNMTNLSWFINGDEVKNEFGFPTRVLNDFEAVGYGIPVLPPDEVYAVNPAAKTVPKGPIAVLGPGTGLGEANLFWDDCTNSYKVFPSEGSHSDFAPRGALQRGLLEYAERVEGLTALEVEQVACGSGLNRIYRYLCHRENLVPEFQDPSQITESALKKHGMQCPTCSKAVDMFLSIVGAEAGHMALRILASGGVYMAGGIPPKLIERIREGNLYNAYTNSSASRFAAIIAQYPLFVVLNDKVGLLGTCEYAMRMARDARASRVKTA